MPPESTSASADPTARGRIRDAAIRRFAIEGFRAPVRVIAQDAGVSAALVMHHFGTKDALRAECDDYVRERVREAKKENTQRIASGGRLFGTSATAAREYSPLIGYVIRSLQDGSPIGRDFIEAMIADAEEYTYGAVQAGLAKPSRDEKARARYLATSAIGALLVAVTLNPPVDHTDLSTYLDDYFANNYLAMIELYTQGFLTSSELFDQYTEFVESSGGQRSPLDPDPPSSSLSTT